MTHTLWDVSQCPCVTVSQYHCVTVSLCHSVPVSQCPCVTVSLCHSVPVSQCPCVTVSLCHSVTVSEGNWVKQFVTECDYIFDSVRQFVLVGVRVCDDSWLTPHCVWWVWDQSIGSYQSQLKPSAPSGRRVHELLVASTKRGRRVMIHRDNCYDKHHAMARCDNTVWQTCDDTLRPVLASDRTINGSKFPRCFYSSKWIPRTPNPWSLVSQQMVPKLCFRKL